MFLLILIYILLSINILWNKEILYTRDFHPTAACRAPLICLKMGQFHHWTTSVVNREWGNEVLKNERVGVIGFCCVLLLHSMACLILQFIYILGFEKDSPDCSSSHLQKNSHFSDPWKKTTLVIIKRPEQDFEELWSIDEATTTSNIL